MTARDDILASLRRRRVEQPSKLPPTDGPWIEYDDPLRQFSETLQMVGGACLIVDRFEDVPSRLEALPVWRDARRRFSGVPGLGGGNVDLDSIDDPHELEDVDVAALPGELAVAENGAVWVSDRGLKHRVIYFIVQHLVLVVSASSLVHNMHQAYARLSLGEPRFGVFISGPSKTADIEQSLVIGAHGPRSHTVLVVRDR
jgi:L-lactate dehydrogenase complex protein LldG